MGKRPRDPMKCWGFGGDNLLSIFFHRHEDKRVFHNIQEDTKINDIERTIHEIHATLEN